MSTRVAGVVLITVGALVVSALAVGTRDGWFDAAFFSFVILILAVWAKSEGDEHD